MRALPFKRLTSSQPVLSCSPWAAPTTTKELCYSQVANLAEQMTWAKGRRNVETHLTNDPIWCASCTYILVGTRMNLCRVKCILSTSISMNPTCSLKKKFFFLIICILTNRAALLTTDRHSSPLFSIASSNPLWD